MPVLPANYAPEPPVDPPDISARDEALMDERDALQSDLDNLISARNALSRRGGHKGLVAELAKIEMEWADEIDKISDELQEG